MRQGATAVAETFRQGVDIEYRSFSNPRPCGGKLKYDKANKSLQVEVTVETPIASAHDQQNRSPYLVMKDMSQIKSRDYADGQSFEWGLCLTQTNGEVHSLVFKRVDERDLFENELRNALSSTHRTDKQEATPGAEQHTRITKVEVKEPPPLGNVAFVQITLDTKEVVDVGMKEHSTKEVFKKEVEELVKKHHILETEATSLYRLVNALASRKRVKEEAEKTIQAIDALHFDQYAKDNNYVVQQPTEGQQLEANKCLDDLRKELPAKIGSAGVGAQLVHGLLVHNIEKMKAINEMTSKFRFKEHAREERKKEAQNVGLVGQSAGPAGSPLRR